LTNDQKELNWLKPMESIIRLSVSSFLPVNETQSAQRGPWINLSMFWVLTMFLVYAMAMVFLLTKSSATYWLRPLIIKSIMAKQGVLGPTPSFLMGNLAEIAKMREDETSKHMSCLNHDIGKTVLGTSSIWLIEENGVAWISYSFLL